MKVTVGTGNIGEFPIKIAAAYLESGDVGALIKITKWPVIALSAAGLAGVAGSCSPGSPKRHEERTCPELRWDDLHMLTRRGD